MATSGSQNFTVTRNDIIEGAMRVMRVLYEGQSANPTQLTKGGEALNMLVKQLQGNSDFAKGLKIWTRKRCTLFLEKGKYKYTLGPNGDHATNSYVETSVKVAAVATDTTVDVNSITGISNADYIGIVLDDGNIHFTTVNGAPSGDTVTLTDQFPSSSAIAKAVYVYTTKVARPLDILFMNIQDSNGEDLPLYPMELDEYESIADKDAAGRPTQYYMEKLRTDVDLYFDLAPTEVTDSIEITYLRPIDDFDAASDEADYPQVWFRALKFLLAIDLAPEYGVELQESVYNTANIALSIAQQSNPEKSNKHFEPGRN